MKQLHDKLALVTGAGSGIGQATALALADAGARVIVTDLQEQSAKATADQILARGQWAESRQLDVADLPGMKMLTSDVEHSLGSPEILVNNAGIAVAGLFLDVSMENFNKLMNINLMGVVNGCHAFLPGMVRSGRKAHVVNIASMAGYTSARRMTAYCTSKFAVLGFSECLRAEMAPHGIGVSAICPGLIKTNIVNAGIFEAPDLDVEEKRKEIDTLYTKRNYSPEKVARKIIRAVRRNRAVVPVAPEAWIAYYVKRWAPWVVSRLARRDLV
jgi:NAD(P)-dependent dehydrogenase (short-subunit alcohol dehydrogenase family)